MRCPVCDVPLSISSREGVEIDFCPQCRGVWLDRGELDKVIERAAASPELAGRGGGSYRDERPRYDDYDDRRRHYDDDDRHRGHYDDDRRHGSDPRKRKRRSFLDDLFDFD